jgi:hypothetical protein
VAELFDLHATNLHRGQRRSERRCAKPSGSVVRRTLTVHSFDRLETRSGVEGDRTNEHPLRTPENYPGLVTEPLGKTIASCGGAGSRTVPG